MSKTFVKHFWSALSNSDKIAKIHLSEVDQQINDFVEIYEQGYAGKTLIIKQIQFINVSMSVRHDALVLFEVDEHD